MRCTGSVSLGSWPTSKGSYVDREDSGHDGDKVRPGSVKMRFEPWTQDYSINV